MLPQYQLKTLKDCEMTTSTPVFNAHTKYSSIQNGCFDLVTHRLVRCASFQDQRQITVTTQKQRVKKGEMVCNLLYV